MFDIGDKVVYPMHGAGIIVAIEDREILGEIRRYYVLKMPINDMEVMVPVLNAGEVGVREVLDIEEMNRVLDVLKVDDEIDMPTNWNRRYRYNMDRIKTGNVEEIAKVVRCLEKLDEEKTLSTGERKMLLGARQIIISEMVLVYGKSIDEMSELVDHIIMES
ncbi:CarD family transcriptional regulator [Anaerosphaera multitolerans]|uniref:CarD family transcriptional regulator n=1 Tax=Anaerosphaera multitolerans TaxID=2487351 RepID=A0A437S5N1_9FIRM|nr:CarD family transcriptional regulator [Anaerosphaera multitolerans]RVU54288.1 CarD family transcriptional regulator [Anaerosphaera multitolerans]